MEAKAARQFRALEPALDALDTQLRAWGLTPGNLAPALAEAYEQSDLFSEHTFGPLGPNGGSWNSGTPRYLYGDAWKAAYARGAYKKYEAGVRRQTRLRPQGGRDRPPRTRRPAWISWPSPSRPTANASWFTTPCPGSGPAWWRSRTSPDDSCSRTDVPANGYRTYPDGSG